MSTERRTIPRRGRALVAAPPARARRRGRSSPDIVMARDYVPRESRVLAGFRCACSCTAIVVGLMVCTEPSVRESDSHLAGFFIINKVARESCYPRYPTATSDDKIKILIVVQERPGHESTWTFYRTIYQVYLTLVHPVAGPFTDLNQLFLLSSQRKLFKGQTI
ncbi:hypothetical protein EVAR_37672_1 [Eumeta japonica]|uniref:Uncharacterized protein n=1 Tax=Eumeta variegata TaxID=151549 RepID=A0A4C1YWT3_EUMVA|nr:hypothetical protein EVAR_37672_1 [Eumeta japonica]